MALTSQSSPLRVDFLPSSETGLEGRLGMTLAPGKQGKGVSGPWARDLDVDLACLRDEHEATRLVTLMEAEELSRFGIGDLVTRAGAAGLDVIHAPIVDGGVPPSPEAVVGLVGRLIGAMARRETVVVHCLGGLGRTGTVAACTLVGLGHDAERAIRVVREARSGTVENDRQAAFVASFARVARGRFAPR